MVPAMPNANASKLTQTIQVPTLPPNLLPQPPKLHPRPSILSPRRRALRVSCSSGDGHRLALELNVEIWRLNSDAARREEALDRSRAILFAEVCDFAGLRPEDLRRRWRRMGEEERWAMARGFVAGWSERFHPLSARSVKEMVDEYLGRADGEGSSGLFEKFLGLF